ncbi:hypothetical protein A3L12_00135 [Thermococcus sp. P6]|uniref:hypothetical protein n=1 Tax=Thermococcus sp. P6 TaxID=122420 RepID=UPI000B59A3A5|nr:hypothetical protein [Thermococcus sp. P6]ASJ09822.1 hypothetical protein A3L12_00135 [Thermococcus sp. P6]
MRVRPVILAFLFLIPAFIAGSYLVRWLFVLITGAFLIFLLFGFEIKVSLPGGKPGRGMNIRTDVERTAALIDKARRGRIARSLIEERIMEVYSTLSDNPGRAFRGLASEPNETIKTLRSEGDFLDNLEKALKIMEEDLNEAGRGKPEE